MADSSFAVKTMKRKNFKALALDKTPTTPVVSSSDAQLPGSRADDASRSAPGALEIGVEFQLDLKTDDLVTLRELGSGNSGTVSKVMHPATKIIMAKKVIHVEANKEAVRKNIVRELHIMKDCVSPDIVTFYGAFLNNAGDVTMCMEYMDAGSLDRISKDFGPVRVDVLGKITVSILRGLCYLYEEHRIMHRDIKPSNVVVNSRGQIKLCDFGVSGELVNSAANTFVGTFTYMAPERISGGASYTIKSDVWSVGLTVMELAIGKFPFNASDTNGDRADENIGILDLLQQIVHEPPPRLPKSAAFPQILDDMIQSCLQREVDLRPTPRQLFDNDNFIQAAKRTPVDLVAWAVEMMQKSNRKSHLQAPLSPNTQALLRGADSPFSAGSQSTAPNTASTMRSAGSQASSVTPGYIEREMERGGSPASVRSESKANGNGSRVQIAHRAERDSKRDPEEYYADTRPQASRPTTSRTQQATYPDREPQQTQNQPPIRIVSSNNSAMPSNQRVPARYREDTSSQRQYQDEDYYYAQDRERDYQTQTSSHQMPTMSIPMRPAPITNAQRGESYLREDNRKREEADNRF